MPVALDRGPGVYIEELPSGVHTIVGVATSTTVFIGWAPQGPTDKAVPVESWTEFQNMFGGLYQGPMYQQVFLGYSVYQFFANGGTHAYILRVVSGQNGANPSKPAEVQIAGGMTVTASGDGLWGDSLRVSIAIRSDDATRFSLSVFQVLPRVANPVLRETYANLSLDPNDVRYVADTVTQDSLLVKVSVPGTGQQPQKVDLAQLQGGLDGDIITPDKVVGALGGTVATNIPLLDTVDLFNLLCVPGLIDPGNLKEFQDYCKSRRAFLIADGDPNQLAVSGMPTKMAGDSAPYGALYFPWIKTQDPNLGGRLRAMPPCGFAAGIYARTDANRGVWKAPAGTEASLSGGAYDYLDQPLTDLQTGGLNSVAVNCVRNFPVYGMVVWGARTLDGNDERGSEWKYVPVRRTALYIEESLFRGLKWVVFEPNDEPLWAQIRLNVGAFMHELFRQGAFQGQTPRDAYFVKCDKETTTQNDINLGIVNILVGFAPLKPAEFVVIQIQQMAGQIQT
jgi:hypothetical protein